MQSRSRRKRSFESARLLQLAIFPTLLAMGFNQTCWCTSATASVRSANSLDARTNSDTITAIKVDEARIEQKSERPEVTSSKQPPQSKEVLVDLPVFFDEVPVTISPEEDDGNYSEALPSAHMTLRRAFALVASGHDEEAIKQYEACPEFFTSPSQWSLIGRRAYGLALEHIGKNEAALQIYKSIKQTDLEARVLVKLKRFKEAKKLATERIAVTDPEYAWWTIHHERAIWYVIRAAAEAGLGEDAAAVADLIEATKTYQKFNEIDRKACTLAANQLIARSGLGKPLELPLEKEVTLSQKLTELRRPKTTGQLEAMVKTSSEKIARDPEVPDYYRDRGRTLAKLHRYEEALVDANIAIQLGGKTYIVERAAIEQAMGQYPAAEDDLNELLANHTYGPETKELCLQLANVYLEHKKYKAAIAAASNAMTGCREQATAYFLRAKAEAALGLTAEAKRDAQTAAKECFDHARIVFRDEIEKWLRSITG